MSGIKVLSVASEVFPLVKTGGLADVAGALPGALVREDVDMRTLIPAYPAVKDKLRDAEVAYDYADLFGAPARVLAGRTAGLDIFALDAPDLFDRPGNPYLGPDGTDWPDNARRFAALARVGADIGLGAVGGFQPNVVHAHDWQAGLVPAYLRYSGSEAPGSLITVHNLAFQGHFPVSLFWELGLPEQALSLDGVEYYGGVGYLKAGLRLADIITTVSPTYAREIQTVDFGMGLDGLLRSRSGAVHGILNGVDETVWDPAKDSALAQTYTALRIDMRARNKSALQKRLGLKPSVDSPLFAVVSRLSHQKGLDLLLHALPGIVDRSGQIALLGSGERWLESGFADAAAGRPGSVSCVFGYDEKLAHIFQAGADFIVVPSRFEPCGLTQLCALRYGATPIVSRVGGLADTIIDANEASLAAGVATGIQFEPPTVEALDHAIDRAFRLFQDSAAVRRMRLNGMRSDVSWRRPAKRYADLYRAISRTAA